MKNSEAIKQPGFQSAFLQGDRSAIVAMGNMFLSANGLTPMREENIPSFLQGQPMYLHEEGSGQWGMSTADAIRCLFDTERTAAFIKGIATGVTELGKTHQPIRVIEAGGGTGILAVAAALAGAQVTIVEINPDTAAEAKRFVTSLGLTKQISIVLGDATIYKPNNQIDMIIAESMHTGLAIEPQVQIVSHLKQFLSDVGILIPQGVRLRFVLAKVDWDSEIQATELRKVNDRIQQIGSWSQIPFVNFMEIRESDAVKFIVPSDVTNANAILIEMDVVVDRNTILCSNQAEFLGHTHVVKIPEPEQADLYFGYLMPGGVFFTQIHPLRRST